METLHRTGLWPLEQLINRGIGLSSTAAALARALAGRCMEIRVDGTPVALRLAVADGRVQLSGAPAAAPADATLAGLPLGLARMLGGDPEAPIRDGDVRLSGDHEVADLFRELLRHARPDIEEELSRVLGDPLAHELGAVAREFARWGQRTAASLARSTAGYFTEERAMLPTRVEVEEFYRAADQIANDVERAEARLARLRNRLS